MDPASEPLALEAINKAVSLKSKATPREQALIEALTHRYSGKAEERQARDRDYADAMRKVHLQFPNDDDIAMLYVESIMDCVGVTGRVTANLTSARLKLSG
jgi:hypothetical protein